jgi:CHAT domain-containing protein
LFVISTDASAKPRLAVYALGIGAAKLNERTQSFGREVASRDPDFRASSRSLHQLLIAPAIRELRGKETVVISPDGPLWQLPFQALSDQSERYLVENYAVSFAPSLTVLSQMAHNHDRPPRRPARLFAVGNPVKDEPLPNAEREVRALEAIYGVPHSRIYTRSEASEQAAKRDVERFDVVHFATHGVFDDRHPMYSYLALSSPAGEAGEADDDGRLEAREITNMKLTGDMVVLSACESARGRVGGGEGLIGMTWAFFIAGSPTTVASQWKVDSGSTTDLMIRFHRGLNSGMPKAESLRHAMLQVMQKPEYRHPFYWAGFVMVGKGV